jgi:hypothetical protein
VQRYLDRGLSYLQLLNDGGIVYVVRIVDRSIPLSLEKYIRDLALGIVNQPLAWILMDYALARSFDFVNYSLDYSLVGSFSGGEAMEN